MQLSLDIDQIVVVSQAELGWLVTDADGTTGPHLSVMVAPVTMVIATVGVVGPETVRISNTADELRLRGIDNGVELTAFGGIGFVVNGAIRFFTTGVAPSVVTVDDEESDPDAPV